MKLKRATFIQRIEETIKHQWFKWKIRFREFFCWHDYKLSIHYRSPIIMHGPVRGEQVGDIWVSCPKCHKTLIHEQGLFDDKDLYTANWGSTRNNFHRDPSNIPKPTIYQAQWMLKVVQDEEKYQKMLKEKGLKDTRKKYNKPWLRGAHA